MVSELEFDRIWQQGEACIVAPKPPDTTPRLCSYASVFEAWVRKHIEPQTIDPQDEVELAQAKVLLLDKYFEWRTYVPKGHKNRISEGRHICIFHIFEQTYEKIKLAELSLSPPKVVVQAAPIVHLPAPPPEPVVQVPALYLGEVRTR